MKNSVVHINALILNYKLFFPKNLAVSGEFFQLTQDKKSPLSPLRDKINTYVVGIHLFIVKHIESFWYTFYFDFLSSLDLQS